ncbi:hypothetical protein CRENBAI_003786, partial [Crenichthys baileyi]
SHRPLSSQSQCGEGKGHRAARTDYGVQSRRQDNEDRCISNAGDAQFQVLPGEDISYFTTTKAQSSLEVFIGLSPCWTPALYFSDTTQENVPAQIARHEQAARSTKPGLPEQKDIFLFLQPWEGGTRDIGSALTKMCMRHRSIEAKLKQFSMCFLEGLINPLQEQMEDWKRGVNTLDKDHAKEYKRARQEIKKKSSDTLKLQKKAKKGP